MAFPPETTRLSPAKACCPMDVCSEVFVTKASYSGMPQRLDQISQYVSYEPDWSSTWKNQSCQCAPAAYGGYIPYFQVHGRPLGSGRDVAYQEMIFQEGFYPPEFVAMNAINAIKCVEAIYAVPEAFGMDPSTSPCLNYPSSSSNSSATSTTVKTTPSTTAVGNMGASNWTGWQYQFSKLKVSIPASNHIIPPYNKIVG